MRQKKNVKPGIIVEDPLDVLMTHLVRRHGMHLLVSDNPGIKKIIDKKIGHGLYRTVYAIIDHPDLVLKVEHTKQTFQNVIEWNVWNRVKYLEKHARWFAPCLRISNDGKLMLMRRTTKTITAPDKLPFYFTDFKLANFGLLDGRFVCHDYATNLLIEKGMANRLRKVDWSKHG